MLVETDALAEESSPNAPAVQLKLTVQMLIIRLFEERVLQEFTNGSLAGTTHTCIGQEATAVGVLSAVGQEDVVFSNHRGHGHFIAHGGDPRGLAAELMGKPTGVCGGRGGSQHLHFENFYSNGVLGGMVACATGCAAAEKVRNSGAVTVTFLGDGALGEGIVYESLNLASLWRLPILYVLENNYYAQTTPIGLNTAGHLAARFAAFGIDVTELATTDVLEVNVHAVRLVQNIRREQKPAGLIVNAFRFSPHSKGDDIRDPAEIERHRPLDPIRIMQDRLLPADFEALRAIARRVVDEAFLVARGDPHARAADLPDSALS